MTKDLTTGEMLKLARVERGLSRWQLADKMGLSREYIKGVEYNKIEIDNAMLDEFRGALGIRKVEDLV
jgi:DNA-binding helix-turn-helix protein